MSNVNLSHFPLNRVQPHSLPEWKWRRNERGGHKYKDKETHKQDRQKQTGREWTVCHFLTSMLGRLCVGRVNLPAVSRQALQLNAQMLVSASELIRLSQMVIWAHGESERRAERERGVEVSLRRWNRLYTWGQKNMWLLFFSIPELLFFQGAYGLISVGTSTVCMKSTVKWNRRRLMFIKESPTGFCEAVVGGPWTL